MTAQRRRSFSERNQKVRGFHFPDWSRGGGSCQVLEGDNKEDELEADSSDATTGSVAVLV